METMYSGKVNSPATTLDGGIDNVVTTINIIDGSVLPVAPNIAVIGTGEDAETILYGTKVVNQLSNITRGFQGIAKEWSTGETIARLFTEYDYNSLKGNIEALFAVSCVPTGSIIAYGAVATPEGWLLCNGGAVSRTTYVTLYGIIGTIYGVGDGSTTFNLPNLKGRVPVGLDSGQVEFDNLAEAGGEKGHTLITGEMPVHKHTMKKSTGVTSGSVGIRTTSTYSGICVTENEGGDGSHNNLQPYLVINYIIKT